MMRRTGSQTVEVDGGFDAEEELMQLDGVSARGETTFGTAAGRVWIMTVELLSLINNTRTREGREEKIGKGCGRSGPLL